MDYDKKLTFAMPEGLELPQGTAENGTVELIATFKLEENGMMCLKAVEGMPLAAYAEPAPDEDGETPSFEGAVEKGL